MGLATRAVSSDELADATLGYASTLATTVSPASLWLTKRQLYGDLHRDLGPAMADAAVLLDAAMGGPDFAAGVQALRDKSDPEFA